jgi:phosphoglycolate phosphatase
MPVIEKRKEKYNFMKIDRCIFDLDGTLLYTIDSIHYYLDKTLREKGIGTISVDVCRSMIGCGSVDLVRRALDFLGRREEGLLPIVHSEYLRAYNEDPIYLTRPYDGILDEIDKLKKSGILLAVWSNKPESSVKPIVEHFFGDSFTVVRGSLPDAPLKPDPTVGFKIIKELDSTPERVAFIGDMEVDIKTSRALGVGLSVGAGWGFGEVQELSRCDLLLDSPIGLYESISGVAL